MKKINRLLLYFALIGLICPQNAQAYLDPGTGSMLVSALVGVAATLFFLLKSSYYKLINFFYRLTGKVAPLEAGNIVFYSEGRQYWNTFKPVLEEFEARGKKAVYLSSDEQDPGLLHAWEYISARYIGQGNRAFTVLNMLEADICVSTTPGLDVLQINRSPGVKHYVHLIHSATDTAYYKLYSFDYFDSVMCSGAHQIKSLRHLEVLRGTKKKLLLETGCCYMDVLAEELEQLKTMPQNRQTPEPAINLLIAPTWGKNGLLNRFGLELLLPLAEKKFQICIRPHPQSFISEPELMQKIEETLNRYSNIHWDRNPSPLPAMLNSDVLLSDLSGIVFDYAFILERPVITVNFKPDNRGLEAGDLPWSAWELDILPQLGANIQSDQITELPEIIASLPAVEDFTSQIRSLRQASIFNFRRTGVVAAEQLLEIQKNIKKTSGSE